MDHSFVKFAGHRPEVRRGFINPGKSPKKQGKVETPSQLSSFNHTKENYKAFNAEVPVANISEITG